MATINRGEWTSDFNSAKAYADANAIPMVVVWSNAGCSYCDKLEKEFKKPEFIAWQHEKNYVMVHSVGDPAVKAFAANSSKKYPYVAVYWNRNGNITKETFTGRSGTMPCTSGSLAQQFMSSVDDIIDNAEGDVQPSDPTSQYIVEDGVLIYVNLDGLTEFTTPTEATAIGDSVFLNCQTLVRITITSNITKIGNNAFQACNGLTSINIPSSVTEIGEYAFSYCSSLTTAILNNTNINIGEFAFFNCINLTTINISDNAIIGDGAFYDCKKLSDSNGFIIVKDIFFQYIGTESSIIIPSNIIRISSYAFYNNNVLTDITLSDKITYIGHYAFYNCSELKNITIPNSVLSIDYSAFQKCNKLSYVTISENIEEIGVDAFLECPNAKVAFRNKTMAEIDSMSNRYWGLNVNQIVIVCSITFDANGGNPPSTTKDVQNGQPIGENIPLDPTYAKHEFVGWFTAKDGGTQVNSSTIVQGNATYYAHWTEKIIITFNANGGTSSESSHTIDKGSAIGKLPTASRTGFVFNGWFTSPIGGSQINSTTTFNADAAIFAQWTEIYEISYKKGNMPGVYGNEQTQTKQKDIDIQLLGSIFVKDNYQQTAWSLNQDGSTADYHFNEEYANNQNLVLYPYWSQLYTISFDKQGGSGGDDSTLVEYNKPLPSIVIPLRDGYDFAGYFKNEEGNGEQYYDANGQGTRDYDLNRDLVLYAYWKKALPTYATPIYSYDDVALHTAKNVNTRILNQSFTKLVKNDIGVFPAFNYIPNIWENKWFNDSTIGGYNKGDVVWKGVMTFNSFLSNYSTIIQKYASQNSIISNYFKYSPENYNEEYQRYQNVVSGYSYKNDNDEYIQVLPMMFDPGSLEYNGKSDITEDSPISIYISIIDDNKYLLSNSQFWKPIALTSQESFNEYISSEISLMIDQHIEDYHLDGATHLSDFENILLKTDFSNFDEKSLYGKMQIYSHDSYTNVQGVDYVVQFGKSPVKWSLSSTYSLYRWYRLWNSGYLEHGGYVEFPAKNAISTSNPFDYTASVDLEWNYGDISALAYDYPTTDAKLDDGMNKRLYFRDGVEQDIDENERVLKNSSRYSVSLTPVDFLLDYVSSTIKYKSIDQISSEAFLSSPQVNNSINFPYINYEIHQLKNSSFWISRSMIDNGELQNKHLNLVQYYVTGYRSSLKRSYNINDCIVVGIEGVYDYTGSQIIPDIVLKSNDGMTLNEGTDYTMSYGINTDIGIKTGSITFYGIDPWRGTMTKTFDIKISLYSNAYIDGVTNSFEYLPTSR